MVNMSVADRQRFYDKVKGNCVDCSRKSRYSTRDGKIVRKRQECFGMVCPEAMTMKHKIWIVRQVASYSLRFQGKAGDLRNRPQNPSHKEPKPEAWQS